MPTSTKKATFTEDDMQHEVNKRAKAQGIDVNIEETGKILDIFEEVAIENIKAGKVVKMRGFGSFEKREQKERNRYNPSTEQTELVPAHFAPKFNPSDALKATVKA